jgi:hypothetical protein
MARNASRTGERSHPEWEWGVNAPKAHEYCADSR